MQFPYLSKLTKSNPHRGLEECKAASPRKSDDRCQKNKQNNKNVTPGALHWKVGLKPQACIISRK